MGLPQEQPSLRPLSFRLTALNRPQYLYIPVHNPTDLPLLVRAPGALVTARRVMDGIVIVESRTYPSACLPSSYSTLR